MLRCNEHHYQGTQPAKIGGESLGFNETGRDSPGKSTAASFHKTGLGKLAREVLKLCSSCFVSLAAVPIETYTALCPSLMPCCAKAVRSVGRCLAASARIGPTICHQNQNRNRRKEDYTFWGQLGEKPSVIVGCAVNQNTLSIDS